MKPKSLPRERRRKIGVEFQRTHGMFTRHHAPPETEAPFRVFEYRLNGRGPWFIVLSTLPEDTADSLREQLEGRHGCAVDVRTRV